MINIDIKFEILSFNPMIEIVYNRELLYKGVAKDSYSFHKNTRFGLKENRNILEIKRYGKDYKLHQSGDKDQAVIIKDIKLNDMSFPHITTHGQFVTDKNETLKTNYLGHNGVYTFTFGHPVETWITNHMYVGM